MIVDNWIINKTIWAKTLIQISDKSLKNWIYKNHGI